MNQDRQVKSLGEKYPKSKEVLQSQLEGYKRKKQYLEDENITEFH